MAKRQTFTYGDLARAPKGTIQLCTGRCGGTWSADRGDYFMRADHEPITCCGRPVRLVQRSTVHTDVTLRSA